MNDQNARILGCRISQTILTLSTLIVTRGEPVPYIRSHTFKIATQHPSKDGGRHLAKMADALALLKFQVSQKFGEN